MILIASRVEVESKKKYALTKVLSLLALIRCAVLICLITQNQFRNERSLSSR